MPLGVLNSVPNVITHAKFDVNRLRGFWVAAPPKVQFPILIWTTLTTVVSVLDKLHVYCLLTWQYASQGDYYRGSINYADLVHKTHVALTEKRHGKLTKISLLLSAHAHKLHVGQAAVFKCRSDEMHHISITFS